MNVVLGRCPECLSWPKTPWCPASHARYHQRLVYYHNASQKQTEEKKQTLAAGSRRVSSWFYCLLDLCQLFVVFLHLKSTSLTVVVQKLLACLLFIVETRRSDKCDCKVTAVVCEHVFIKVKMSKHLMVAPGIINEFERRHKKTDVSPSSSFIDE